MAIELHPLLQSNGKLRLLYLYLLVKYKSGLQRLQNVVINHFIYYFGCQYPFLSADTKCTVMNDAFLVRFCKQLLMYMIKTRCFIKKKLHLMKKTFQQIISKIAVSPQSLKLFVSH